MENKYNPKVDNFSDRLTTDFDQSGRYLFQSLFLRRQSHA